MELHPSLLEVEPTPSQEALRLIVEVFRDGHRAATDLRTTAMSLTPNQLELELGAIEEMMLSQITVICDNYQLHQVRVPRH